GILIGVAVDIVNRAIILDALADPAVPGSDRIVDGHRIRRAVALHGEPEVVRRPDRLVARFERGAYIAGQDQIAGHMDRNAIPRDTDLEDAVLRWGADDEASDRCGRRAVVIFDADRVRRRIEGAHEVLAGIGWEPPQHDLVRGAVALDPANR